MDQPHNHTGAQGQREPTEEELDEMLDLIRTGDDNKENMPPQVLEAAPEVSARMGRPHRPAFRPIPPEYPLESIEFLPRFGDLALSDTQATESEERPGAPDGWDQHGRRYERPLSAMGENDPFPYGRRMPRPLHRQGRRMVGEDWAIWVDDQEEMEARRRERREERSMAPSPEPEERSVLSDVTRSDEAGEGGQRGYAEILARVGDGDSRLRNRSLRRRRGTSGLRQEARMESPLRHEVSFHR